MSVLDLQKIVFSQLSLTEKDDLKNKGPTLLDLEITRVERIQTSKNLAMKFILTLYYYVMRKHTFDKLPILPANLGEKFI